MKYIINILLLFALNINAQSTEVYFNLPSDGEAFEIGSNIIVDVSAESIPNVAKVTLYLNDVELRHEGVSPFLWNDKAQDSEFINMQDGVYILKAVVLDTSNNTFENSITFLVGNIVTEPPVITDDLIEVFADSISAEFTMVNKGLIQVLKNGDLATQHQRKDKADGSAYSLYLKNPLDTIEVISPKSVPEVSYKVYLRKSKLSGSSEMFFKIKELEGSVEVQTITIANLLQELKYVKTRDSLKIKVLENRISNLIQN